MPRGKWDVVTDILKLKSDQGKSNAEVSSYGNGGICIVCDKTMTPRSELKINNYDVHHACFKTESGWWKDDLQNLLHELKRILE